MEMEEDKIIRSKPFPHRTLEERMAAYDGRLNLSEELPQPGPVGSEVW